jgi:hypothetical protein
MTTGELVYPRNQRGGCDADRGHTQVQSQSGIPIHWSSLLLNSFHSVTLLAGSTSTEMPAEANGEKVP